jgi:hypothetical protein
MDTIDKLRAEVAVVQARLRDTQAGLTIWMERSKANAKELDEAYDAMCEIAKTLDCAEDWAAIKVKLAEAQKDARGLDLKEGEWRVLAEDHSQCFTSEAEANAAADWLRTNDAGNVYVDSRTVGPWERVK